MGHFTHYFIKVETVSHNEVVWDDKPTVIALKAITQRSVLFAKNASLHETATTDAYATRRSATLLNLGNQNGHCPSRIDNILDNNDIPSLQFVHLDSRHID